jgi:hypothetical protein
MSGLELLHQGALHRAEELIDDVPTAIENTSTRGLTSGAQRLGASNSCLHSEDFTSSKLNCLSSLSYGLPSTST